MDVTARLLNQLLVVLYHKLKSTNDQIVYIEHMRLLHQKLFADELGRLLRLLSVRENNFLIKK